MASLSFRPSSEVARRVLGACLMITGLAGPASADVLGRLSLSESFVKSQLNAVLVDLRVPASSDAGIGDKDPHFLLSGVSDVVFKDTVEVALSGSYKTRILFFRVTLRVDELRVSLDVEKGLQATDVMATPELIALSISSLPPFVERRIVKEVNERLFPINIDASSLVEIGFAHPMHPDVQMTPAFTTVEIDTIDQFTATVR